MIDAFALLAAPLVAAAAVIVVGRALARRVNSTHRALPGAGHAPRFRARTWASMPKSAKVAMVAMVAIGGVAVIAMPFATGVTIGALALWRRLRPIRQARRRRNVIERDLPTVMDLLVLSVRAGLSPRQAVVELSSSTPGPVGEALGRVVHRVERGEPFTDALDALAVDLGPPAVGLVDVIVTSGRNGLPLGPMLDQLSIEVRAARRRYDQAEARKLPVRLSFPLVVCTLPSFVLLAIVPAMIAALSSLGGSAR